MRFIIQLKGQSRENYILFFYRDLFRIQTQIFFYRFSFKKLQQKFGFLNSKMGKTTKIQFVA